MKSIKLLTFLFAISLSTSSFARTIKIYGEAHRTSKCIEQRTLLAAKATQGTTLLFGENLYFNQTQKAMKENRESLGLVSFQNVYGLEDFNLKYYILSITYLNKILDSYGNQLVLHKDYKILHKVDKDYLFAITALKTVTNLPVELKKYLDYEEILTYECKSLGKCNEYVFSNIISKAKILIRELYNLVSQVAPANIPSLSEISNEYESYQLFLDEYPQYRHSYSKRNIEILVLWRNHLMIDRLAQKLNEPAHENTDEISIILGAAHVHHFIFLMKTKYYEQFVKNGDELYLDLSCWNGHFTNI